MANSWHGPLLASRSRPRDCRIKTSKMNAASKRRIPKIVHLLWDRKARLRPKAPGTLYGTNDVRVLRSAAKEFSISSCSKAGS